MLVYADDVNMLGENLQTIRKNTEILLKANKDIGLEVNSEKTKYMITSHQQNIVIENLTFENVENMKYLGVTVPHTNYIREEVKCRIGKHGKYMLLLTEKILSSYLLSKKLNVNTRKTVILPVVWYGCET